MTIPDLIQSVLGAIRRDHYAERENDYYRDKRALIKAISLYGYECHQRGWAFEAPMILREIMTILVRARVNGVQVQYMPAYLSGAIRKHLGMRSDELSRQAKRIAPRAAKIIKNTQCVQAVREQSGAEILAGMFRTIKPPHPKGQTKDSQMGLAI